jgi:hypothetical protein
VRQSHHRINAPCEGGKSRTELRIGQGAPFVLLGVLAPQQLACHAFARQLFRQHGKIRFRKITYRYARVELCIQRILSSSSGGKGHINDALWKRLTASCTVERATPRLPAISEYERFNASRRRANSNNGLMGNLLKLIDASAHCKDIRVTHIHGTGLHQIAIPACTRLLYRLGSDSTSPESGSDARHAAWPIRSGFFRHERRPAPLWP